MSYGTNKTVSNPFSYFNCTNYRQFGKKAGTCTAHYIRYDVLYQYVLTRIRYWAKEAHTDEEKLLEALLRAGDRERAAHPGATVMVHPVFMDFMRAWTMPT